MPPKKKKEPRIGLNFVQAELNDEIMSFLLNDSDDDFDTCDDSSSDDDASETSTNPDLEWYVNTFDL